WTRSARRARRWWGWTGRTPDGATAPSWRPPPVRRSAETGSSTTRTPRGNG
ncbi:MAG: hypothetical protein AVDCRST_MAG66-4627, partial [uncultured Pseudonocardia sp.]